MGFLAGVFEARLAERVLVGVGVIVMVVVVTTALAFAVGLLEREHDGLIAIAREAHLLDEVALAEFLDELAAILHHT
jgi:hypothetical protein